MTQSEAQHMSVRLEHLAWSWRQGAPVRVGELEKILVELREIAERTGLVELRQMATRVEALVAALHEARRRADAELAAIPSRRRAMRAHALRFDPAVGVHLRRRA